MNYIGVGLRAVVGVFASGLLLSGVGFCAAPEEVTIDVLQIGTQTYSNVTVTTRSADYVFILHSTGMKNFKVSQLTAEQRELLGYAPAKKEISASETAQNWAKQALEKVDAAPQFKAVEQQVQQRFKAQIPPEFELKKLFTITYLGIALGIMLVLHLFFSWCCALICVKAGGSPGVLVWIPALQLIPLLRAAGMSAWWFLAYFVPLLNIVAQVMWSIKIAQARGKTLLVGIMLLLPVLNLLAFLYLAFSNGTARAEKKPQRKVEIMTLETA